MRTRQCSFHSRWISILTAVAVIGSLVFISPIPASALAKLAMKEIYSDQAAGTIATVGNALMTCPSQSSSCQSARDSSTDKTRPANNNHYVMEPIKADPQAPGKIASSSTLTIPQGAKVDKAFLIWGAMTQRRADNASLKAIDFKAPGGTYTRVVPTSSNQAFSSSRSFPEYAAMADVTDIVKKAGAGEYWAGGLTDLVTNGTGGYAGWSLFVVLKGSIYKVRDLRVYFGHKGISSSTSTSSKANKVTIKGLKTPPLDKVNAKASILVFEGDQGFTRDTITVKRIDSSGDTVDGSEEPLSDALSDADNFFTSRISRNGKNVTTRKPNYVNNFGIDLKDIDLTGKLHNNDTGIEFSMQTKQDAYIVSGFASEIELYVPNFDSDVSKSVKNLTSGSTTNRVGDILEYTIQVLNSGKDHADNFRLNDQLHSSFEYVKNSIKLDGVKLTDKTGDDKAEFIDNTVRARVGKGADAKKGGTISPSEKHILTYRVKVKSEAQATTIPNTADFSFTQRTLGGSKTQKTNKVEVDIAPVADLSITKTGSKEIDAGGAVSWTLKAHNYGPSASNDVSVIDKVPAFVDNVTVNPTNRCSIATDNTVTCRFPTLGVNKTETITIKGKLKDNEARERMVNAAVISSETTGEPLTDKHPNSTEYGSNITRNADLEVVSKSVSPTTVKPGEKQTWTIKVKNNGTSDAEKVTVKDKLDPAFTVTKTPTLSDGTKCAVNAGDITCDLGTMKRGQEETITFVTRVDPDDKGNRDLENIAKITSSTPDKNRENNKFGTKLHVAPSQANLHLEKKALAPHAYAGETITYSLIATNDGPSRGKNLVVTDTLPQGLTPLKATTPTGKSCTIEKPSRRVTCPIGDLSVKGTVTLTIEASVASSAQGNLTNTATLHADNSPDKTANKTIPVKTRTELVAQKNGPKNPVNAGDPAKFTLNVTNEGPSDARNVVITDTLPDALTYKSATVTSGKGSCEENNGLLTCTFASLARDQKASVDLAVVVKQNAQPEQIENTMLVDSKTDEIDDTNNRATARFPTKQSADMEVAKTVMPTSDNSDSGESEEQIVNAGETIKWKLNVRNAGPSQTENAKTIDTLPDEVLFDTVVATSKTPGVTCTKSAENRTVTCQKDEMAAEEEFEVTISAKIDPGTEATSIINSSTVESSLDDPALPNVSSTQTRLGRNADLNIVKTLHGEGGENQKLVAGQNATWMLTVSNDGPSVAKDVIVADRLPDELSYVSASSESGDYRCEKPEDAETLQCHVGDMKPGQTIAISVTTKVAPSVTSGTKIHNLAATYSKGNTPDTNSKNNKSEVDREVITKEDLSIEKFVVDETLVSGTDTLYFIRVINNGPSWAHDAGVVDTLPDGLELLENGTTITSTGNECTVSGKTVTCTFDSVAVGEDNAAIIAIPVAVTSEKSSVTNSASVRSKLTTTAKEANITTPVTRIANLGALKWAQDREVIAGTGMTWHIGAVNDGPSRAENVKLTDKLADNLEFISASEGCTYNDDTREVTCEIASLEAGKTVEREIVVLVDSATPPGDNSNTVTVSQNGGASDLDDSDDARTKKVSVKRYSEFSLDKLNDDELVSAGETVNWTLRATNVGPSQAKGVTVSDTMPEGITAKSARAEGATCSIEESTVTCTFDKFPVGTIDIAIEADVSPSYKGEEIKNTASLKAESPFNPAEGEETIPASSTVPVIHRADIDLQKASTPEGDFTPGEDIEYTLVATNKGPAVTTGLEITDSLASGLTNVTATSSKGTCTVKVPEPKASAQPSAAPDDDDPVVEDDPGSATVICKTNEEVSIGEQVTVTIKARLAPDYMGDFENRASSNSDTLDPDNTNNLPHIVNKVTPRADVHIEKTATEPVVSGDLVQWSLVVTNDGPSLARDIVVTDSVDGAVSDLVVTRDDKKKCTIEAKNKVTCRRESLDPGKILTITVKGKLAADYQGELENQAMVTTNTFDPDTTNNTGSVSKESQGKADISIEKTLQGQAVAGRNVEWKLGVNNAGPSLARDVTVTDQLPKGVSSISAQGSDGTQCAVKSSTITCKIAALASGKTTEVTVKGHLSPSATGDLANTATAKSSTPDTTTDNNSATSTSAITTQADLSLKKTALTAKPIAGKSASWKLEVKNAGPSSARDVTLTDTLPKGISKGRVLGDQASACSVENQTITCHFDTIGLNQLRTITVQAEVSPDFVGKVNNSAQIVSQTPDPDLRNNEAGTSSESSASAQLQVTKTLRGSAASGKLVSWDVAVNNAGPSTAKNVVVTDKLPAGVSGATIKPATGCEISKDNLRCVWDSMKPGSEKKLRISGTLDADFSGKLENTVSATSDTSTPVSATSTSPTTQTADLAITKTVKGTITAGKDATWELMVSNKGSATAKNIVVTDSLPKGVSDIRPDGDGMKCSVDDNTVTCRLDALGVGKDKVVTIQGHISSNLEGDVSNEATVSADTADNDLSNNSTVVDSASLSETDLHLTKTVDKKKAKSGDRLTWKLEIGNEGSSDAKDVLVKDTLPKGVAFDGLPKTSKGTACKVKGQVLDCRVDRIEMGKTVVVTIPTKVSVTKTTEVRNTASVIPASPTDPAMENNMSSVSVEVTAPPVSKPNPDEGKAPDEGKSPGEGSTGATGDPDDSVSTDRGKKKFIPLSKTGVDGSVGIVALIAALLGSAMIVSRRRKDTPGTA